MSSRQLIENFSRRKILTIAAVLIGLVDVTLLIRWIPREQVDIEVDITQTSEIVTVKDLRDLPIFDPIKKRWTVGGREISMISQHLVDPDPQRIGPDSVGLYLPLQISGEEGLQAVHWAARSVAESGICQIAVFGTPTASEIELEASVLKIRRYRGSEGKLEKCNDTANSGYGHRTVNRR
jgi:hypothetical protein